MDDSIAPDSADESGCDDLPVDLKTLAIDGVNPEMGDTVDLKVRGSVKKIVNDVAWVTPDTINGQPVPQGTMDASEDEIMQGAKQHDAAMMGGMGGMMGG